MTDANVRVWGVEARDGSGAALLLAACRLQQRRRGRSTQALPELASERLAPFQPSQGPEHTKPDLYHHPKDIPKRTYVAGQRQYWR